MQRRRILMQSQVLPPPGYKFIEYAENRNNGVVELPFGFESTDYVEFKMSINGTKSGDAYLVAPKTWNNNGNRYGMGYHSGKQYCFAYGNVSTSNTYLLPYTVYDLSVVVWVYANQFVSVKNKNIGLDVSSIKFGGVTDNLKLFFGYNTTTSGRIYYYKHQKANGTVYNIVPIQHKTTGVVEMYDTVSQTIMQRTGTLYPPEE